MNFIEYDTYRIETVASNHPFRLWACKDGKKQTYHAFKTMKKLESYARKYRLNIY